MNFAFVTCVQLGLSCIKKIYEIDGKLDLLITLKDEKAINKSGRIYLDDFAKKNNIPLLKVNHINDKEVLQAIVDYKIDWLFIIGWSQIASVDIINAPQRGVLGIHPTLLPQGRGRAAIPWAIIKNLEYTGVTMFKIDEGVDTGDIVLQKRVNIDKEEDSKSLYEKVNVAHEELIAEVYPLLESNEVSYTKQDEALATYWEGRKPEDGLLSIEMDVYYVERMIRALTKPYPGAFINHDGKHIIIWKAHVSIEKPVEDNVIMFNGGYIVLDEYEII